MSTVSTSDTPIVVDEITLNGKTVRVQLVNIPLDHLQLDPNNLRVSHTSAEHGDLQQASLEALLWDDAVVQGLSRQILRDQRPFERIIVRCDGRVLEGNCRTLVYRKLRESHPAEDRWRTIPARVLPMDISEHDTAMLLAEMHVAGKNTWTPFEKAGHIYRLHHDFGLIQDEIAARLRMSKSKVNQLVRAFEMMKNQYLPAYPGPASTRQFSYFEEVFKKPRLRKRVLATTSSQAQFIHWIGTGRLNHYLQVRDLPAILDDDEAVAALTGEGFSAAQGVLGHDNPLNNSKLFKRMVEMSNALNKAQLDDVQRVRKARNSRALSIVKELRDSLDHFIELSGIER